MKGYLLRFGADPMQAEDMALDVMAAVWRKAAGFDRHLDSAAVWIFRIARNRRLATPRPARLAPTQGAPMDLSLVVAGRASPAFAIPTLAPAS